MIGKSSTLFVVLALAARFVSAAGLASATTISGSTTADNADESCKDYCWEIPSRFSAASASPKPSFADLRYHSIAVLCQAQGELGVLSAVAKKKLEIPLLQANSRPNCGNFATVLSQPCGISGLARIVLKPFQRLD